MNSNTDRWNGAQLEPVAQVFQESKMDEFNEFMRMRYDRAAKYQTEKKQRIFNLTFEEYLDLHTKAQMTNLQTRFENGTINGFLGSRFGFVMGWQSREGWEAGVIDPTTVTIMTRQKSKIGALMKKGENHSAATKAKISKSKLGVKHSAEHCAKRSAAQKGIKRGPMSEDHKAKIREGKRRKKEQMK